MHLGHQLVHDAGKLVSRTSSSIRFPLPSQRVCAWRHSQLAVEHARTNPREDLRRRSACAQTAPNAAGARSHDRGGRVAERVRGDAGARPSRARSSAGRGSSALYSGVAKRTASAPAIAARKSRHRCRRLRPSSSSSSYGGTASSPSQQLELDTRRAGAPAAAAQEPRVVASRVGGCPRCRGSASPITSLTKQSSASSGHVVRQGGLAARKRDVPVEAEVPCGRPSSRASTLDARAAVGVGERPADACPVSCDRLRDALDRQLAVGTATPAPSALDALGREA